MRPLAHRSAWAGLLLTLFVLSASAQDTPESKAKQISDLEKQIADLQKKIADLKTPAKKSLTINDANAWRGLRGAALSPDGQWFAARIAPLEGDSEILVKATKGDKEYKFPGGSALGMLGFAADSKYLAFTALPAARPGSPVQGAKPKVVLVALATGEKTEFEGFRSFAFNGELATHIAFRKAPPEAAPTPTTPGLPLPKGAFPTAPTGSSSAGTDLIIRELATGSEITLGNIGDFSFNKQGNWLALVIDSAGELGNGVQLRDMKTSALYSVETGKAKYESLVWHEKGEAFTVMKGTDEKGIEGKFYSVLGFTDLGPKPTKTVFNPLTEATFPKNMGIVTTRSAFWNDDLSAFVFGIAEQKRAPEAKKDEPKKDGPPTQPGPRPSIGAKPDLVVWHWQDERLQSQQQVQAGFDKSFNFLCVYRVKDKKFLRLADDTVRNVSLAPKHEFALGVDTKPYQLMSTLDGRRFSDIYVINTTTGERKKALTKVRYSAGLSPDGKLFLYHDDGHYRTLELATLKTFNITEKVPAKFYNDQDDHNMVKPPSGTLGWSDDGKFILLSDNWDVWQVGTRGESAVNLTLDGVAKQIRYSDRVTLDPQEKGINLTKPQIFATYGEWTKKSGYSVWTPGKPGVTPLVFEDAEVTSLQKAKNADTFMYMRQTALEAPTVCVASDATLKDAKKFTNTNPQQANYQWMSGAKLIDYVGLNGQKLQGALYLPANYQPGKKYPTIVYIYEKLSQEIHRYQGPSTGGFNKSIYTSNGYAVLMPDITYQLNDPGISAVKCILPALDAAIATGVVDDGKVGLHGHSWGGYQTAFLITQTDRFKAAIAGAPLTNLVSMYSSIYWNSGSANQPIFESSQGRFTSGYFDLQEAYLRNSPVFHAKRVTTPLLLLHNDKDGAVDWTQGIEYFNTLRRLQKPVVMLQYKGENHGLVRPENRRDYAVRMREFFDHHLQGKPAPDWWKEGVPHLKIDDHLSNRPKE